MNIFNIFDDNQLCQAMLGKLGVPICAKARPVHYFKKHAHFAWLGSLHQFLT